MLPMLSVVYNPLSAYIVGYKTVHLQYIRRAVVKDTLLLLVSAICVIIMCCFLLYDVINSAQYEYYDIAYLSEISKGGSGESNETNHTVFTKTASSMQNGLNFRVGSFWHENHQ